MIALDASVVLAFLADADPHHGRAIELLSAADEFGLHTVTLAECFVRGERDGRVDEVAGRISELGIRELDRRPGEARHLARIRLATGLRMPDCCVVLAAELTGAPLATFDERLARAARSRGLEVLGADG